jgi:phenylacetate-coenzyme A ligase PaaK-like adenylate-forming protein
MAKTALILEGGGYRGIYTGGVLDVFQENGIDGFSSVWGVSAGAMNGGNFLARQDGRTMRVMERISARSDDMLIIHGVNVFPGQIEAGLLRVPEVAPHYQIVLSSTETLDRFEIKVEVSPEAFSDNIRHMEDLRKRVLDAVKSIIGLTPHISLVEPNTLPRSEGKIKRVIDNRRK